MKTKIIAVILAIAGCVFLFRGVTAKYESFGTSGAVVSADASLGSLVPGLAILITGILIGVYSRKKK
jgi:uncharacterized membrane protein (DUF106 family)